MTRLEDDWRFKVTGNLRHMCGDSVTSLIMMGVLR